MNRIRRASAIAISALGVILTLSACTPAVTQYWHLSSDGELRTAWCYNQTIDSLTVTFVANNTEDSLPSQTYTVEGPPLFVEEGQVISLSRVAPGWTTPPSIDIGADWYAIRIQSTRRSVSDYAGYVERTDLSVDEWVASPPPGFNTVMCELQK